MLAILGSLMAQRSAVLWSAPWVPLVILVQNCRLVYHILSKDELSRIWRSATMLRDRYEPDPFFWAIIEQPAVEMEAELAQIDKILDDDLFQLIKHDMSQRYPLTLETGRESTPVEVNLHHDHGAPPCMIWDESASRRLARNGTRPWHTWHAGLLNIITGLWPA
jgi:hypothetical protein